MQTKEIVKAERAGVFCTFIDTAGIRGFFTADKKDATRILIKELDERRIVSQWGKLIFEGISETGIPRVELDADFRGIGWTRIFITLNNNEALNMLMNKLKRKRISNQPGTLIFEFVPQERNIDKQICTCGHSRYAHADRDYIKRKDSYGRCEVEDCECQQCDLKENKEAPK